MTGTLEGLLIIAGWAARNHLGVLSAALLKAGSPAASPARKSLASLRGATPPSVNSE